MHSHIIDVLRFFVVLYKCMMVCFTQDVELPDSLSDEMKSLLHGLLKRDVSQRLGCQGRGYVHLLPCG